MNKNVKNFIDRAGDMITDVIEALENIPDPMDRENALYYMSDLLQDLSEVAYAKYVRESEARMDAEDREAGC